MAQFSTPVPVITLDILNVWVKSGGCAKLHSRRLNYDLNCDLCDLCDLSDHYLILNYDLSDCKSMIFKWLHTYDGSTMSHPEFLASQEWLIFSQAWPIARKFHWLSFSRPYKNPDFAKSEGG